MNALVEQLLELPTLPEVVDELQARLAEERVRRGKFYAEMVEGQKTEFINGQVIMHSPSKVHHLRVKEHLVRLLGFYVDLNKLGWVASEKALCVFPRNDYEPDVCYFGQAKAALLQPRQLHLPIPDFIAEVLSDSTEKTDRGEKFQDYQAHGVQEYWMIDPEQEMLEQYVIGDGKYHLAQKSSSGQVRSVVIGGFVIPVRAVFDAQLNLAVLRELLAQPPRPG